jgi:hypothetical protein
VSRRDEPPDPRPLAEATSARAGLLSVSRAFRSLGLPDDAPGGRRGVSGRHGVVGPGRLLQGQIELIVADGGEVPIPFAEEATVPAKRKISTDHRRKLVKALAKARKMRWASRYVVGSCFRRLICVEGDAGRSSGADFSWGNGPGSLP